MHRNFWVFKQQDYFINNHWLTVDIHHLWIFFWDEALLSRIYEIYLSIKDWENLVEFNLLQNLNLCTQNPVSATNFRPFGEIGVNFSLHFSSQIQFAQIRNKKVISENQCEKRKNLSLVDFIFSKHMHLP